MFKWTGGKRREVPRLLPHLPAFAVPGGDWEYHEPFAGGASMMFALAHPRSHLSDLDSELVNFYQVAAQRDQQFLAEVARVATLFGKGKRSAADRDAQAAAYYAARDLDRSPGLGSLAPWQRAARFFVVNQLAFSGMRRFNSDGHFNIPFGHYKTFNVSVLSSEPHLRLLASCTFRCQDYQASLAAADKARSFVFLDPPYTRVMRTYSADAPFSDSEHRRLAAALIEMRHGNWMMVIDRSPLTEELYGDYVVDSYPVAYGVNIKNRFSQDAEHIVAVNYVTSSGATPAALSARQEAGSGGGAQRLRLAAAAQATAA